MTQDTSSVNEDFPVFKHLDKLSDEEKKNFGKFPNIIATRKVRPLRPIDLAVALVLFPRSKES